MTKEKLNMIIGSNIKKYRKLKGITQQELASKINVTSPLIGALESTKMNHGISTYTLYKISKVLNVPINNFFEEKH